MARKKSRPKQEPNEPPESSLRRHRPLLLAAALVALGVAAYHNALSGPFIFDDNRWIENGDRIREGLWPLRPFFAGTLRPVFHFSLAVNYRLGGLDVTGYRVFNVAAHVATALLLFGVVRLTLRLPRLRERYEQNSDWLAFAVAALWVVHPLNSQAVNYCVQRCEIMMSACLLACLYCVVRARDARRPWLWYGMAVVASTVGMGCKPVMIVAPFVVLLFDRVFIANSWGELVRSRWLLYVALLPGWLWLALSATPGITANVQASASGVALAPSSDTGRMTPPTPTASQAKAVSPVADSRAYDRVTVSPRRYALSQPAIILHYLRLVIWPNPLCLDYQWPAVRAVSEAIPALPAVVVLLIVSLIGLRYCPPLGFLGVAFFLILAPTSSIMPINDLAFEHRMYLPSAAVIALLVFAADWLLPRVVARTTWNPAVAKRLATALAALAVVALLAGTIGRNFDYQSRVSIWRSVVNVRPRNLRGWNNLSQALISAGNRAEAAKALLQAQAIAPHDPVTQGIIGEFLLAQGRNKEAVQQLRGALAARPADPVFHLNLGAAYERLGNGDKAIFHFENAAYYGPGMKMAHKNLGYALVQSGRIQEGIEAYRKALSCDPDYFDAHLNLGAVLAEQKDLPGAIHHFHRARQIEPTSTDAHRNLALAFADSGRRREAIAVARRAVDLAEAQNKLLEADQLRKLITRWSTEP